MRWILQTSGLKEPLQTKCNLTLNLRSNRFWLLRFFLYGVPPFPSREDGSQVSQHILPERKIVVICTKQTVGAFIGRPPSNSKMFMIKNNFINVTKMLFYCSGEHGSPLQMNKQLSKNICLNKKIHQ